MNVLNCRCLNVGRYVVVVGMKRLFEYGLGSANGNTKISVLVICPITLTCRYKLCVNDNRIRCEVT
jgi:hypothetical protein